MRPLKFRVWDKHHHAMQHSHNLLLDSYDGALYWQCGNDPPAFLDQEHFTLMQFTGLHDTHGKEIWEGDVVEFQTIRGVVEFRDSAFEVMRDVAGGPTGTGTLREGEPLTCDYTILGNIYEHPDLLQEASHDR